MAALKGEKASPDLRCTLNLGLDIRIPSEYIESENLRLRTYKRIAGITGDSEKEEVRRELEDRFGPLPPAVGNLLEYAVLKAECEKLLVSSIERQGDRVAAKFHPETPLDPSLLVRVIGKHTGIRLDPSGAMWMEWNRGQGGLIGALRNVLLELQPQG